MGEAEGGSGGGVPVFWGAVDEGDGEDGLAGGEFDVGEGGGGGSEGNFGDAEVSGGFVEGGGGTAVGPSATEGYVDAEAEFSAFGLSVVDAIEHGWAEKGLVDDLFGGIVEYLGIDEGQFCSSDAVGSHLLEFAEDLGFFDGGAEPPPADHGLGFLRRILKVLLEGKSRSLSMNEA